MRPTINDWERLQHGPYQIPALRGGDRATCVYHGRDVVVHNWTDAPISWPRCTCAAATRSRPTLPVDDELARAIRTESAIAIGFWWGGSGSGVHDWRTALSVQSVENPGSRHAIRLAALKGGAVRRKEARERRRKRTGRD
jgi:hypothetical protein